MNLSTVLHKLMSRFRERCYKWEVRGVLETSPLQRGHRQFVALSMVHHKDVLPYLVAIKTFAAFTSPHRICVVCDPTITEEDRTTFRHHIPHIELIKAEDHRHPDLPVGGTWERLQAICSLSPDNYVVQVDADTIALMDMPHVVAAIDAGKAFVIGEEPNQPIMTLEQATERGYRWTNQHIQAHVERLLSTSNVPMQRYVRGCSGFTGFPADPEMLNKALAFSAVMTRLCGDRWREWGTEQITSNYLVANAHGAAVLPYPEYCTPKGTLSGLRFGHFIGFIRFSNNLYRQGTKLALANVLR